MAQQKIYEGTLEEITRRYGKELADLRLKVMIASEENAMNQTVKPFYETATSEEWSRAWRDWAENHDRNTPLLSDEAISRDSIYEGRG